MTESKFATWIRAVVVEVFGLRIGEDMYPLVYPQLMLYLACDSLVVLSALELSLGKVPAGVLKSLHLAKKKLAS